MNISTPPASTEQMRYNEELSTSGLQEKGQLLFTRQVEPSHLPCVSKKFALVFKLTRNPSGCLCPLTHIGAADAD